jgi:hypothetical protein
MYLKYYENILFNVRNKSKIYVKLFRARQLHFSDDRDFVS